MHARESEGEGEREGQRERERARACERARARARAGEREREKERESKSGNRRTEATNRQIHTQTHLLVFAIEASELGSLLLKGKLTPSHSST